VPIALGQLGTREEKFDVQKIERTEPPEIRAGIVVESFALSEYRH